MSAVQRLTGKNLALQWIDATGTVIISGDQRSFDVDWGQDVVDLAAADDSYHYNYETLLDWSGKLEAIYIGASGTAVAARLEPGDSGTLIWAPLGTATGKPKWGMGVIVTKNNVTYPFDKEVMVSTEFKVKGGIVFNGNTAVY